MELGDVRARLIADTSQWTQRFKEANGDVTALGTAVGVFGGQLAANFTMKVLESAVALANFASNVTEAAGNAAEAMDLIAQRTGLTNQALQELQPIMNRNNVSAQEMGMMFSILSRHIAEARDTTSKAGQNFAQLGITLSGLESPAQVLTLLAERIKTLPDGFEKTRLETELLGRSGAKLTAFLNEGASGFERSAQQAKIMGNVLSTDANNALLKVNDSFDDLTTRQDNLSKHLGVLFAPMIQSYNEAKGTVVDGMVTFIDNLTIATRTLAIRLEALFGFLKAQAQLSVLEIGKIPEIFERWDHWAKEQIEATRKQSIAVNDLGTSFSAADAHVQAFYAHQAGGLLRMDMGLMEMDLGWKIVEESLKQYTASMVGQSHLGAQIVAQTKDMIAFEQTAGQLRLDHAIRGIDQFKNLEAQYRAVSQAALQAALAAGRLTESAFSKQSTALTVEGIQQEIAAIEKRQRATTAYYNTKLSNVLLTETEVKRLTQEAYVAEETSINQRELLQQQLVTAKIRGTADAAAAFRKEEQANLDAAASMADSELRIMQATSMDMDEIRAARLNQIEVGLARELHQVNLTEMQKRAIYAKAEADRMALTQQFPTFYERQLQALVQSNAFSMATITNQFSGAVAAWIVQGTKFKQFWISLQTTLLQSMINMLIQAGAEFLLKKSAEVGIMATVETAKTAVFGTNETARMAIASASNKVMMAGVIATLGGLAAVGQAAVALATSMLSIMSTALAMIAGALGASVIGAPLAPAVAAASGMLAAGAGMIGAIGTAAIQGALGAAVMGATTALATPLAEGGIVMSPTLALIGEKGPEAVTPLDRAGFGQQTIIVQFDGREVARLLEPRLRDLVYIRVGV